MGTVREVQLRLMCQAAESMRCMIAMTQTSDSLTVRDHEQLRRLDSALDSYISECASNLFPASSGLVEGDGQDE